ncbi:hypothetical protein K6025_05095 [Ehrlichia sp. JZT12]
MIGMIVLKNNHSVFASDLMFVYYFFLSEGIKSYSCKFDVLYYMTNVLLGNPDIKIFDGKTEVMLDCKGIRILREVGLPIVKKDFEEIKLVIICRS